jgi:hypothetical protein
MLLMKAHQAWSLLLVVTVRARDPKGEKEKETAGNSSSEGYANDRRFMSTPAFPFVHILRGLFAI